jgi:PTS system nitrogen regulatory IIA component
MEFLQEEYIQVGLEAEDKWEALRKLTTFYARSHRLKPGDRKVLFKSIEEREQQVSTALGLGAAIPHGRTDRGDRIQGVLGIFPKGVDFGAPDGEPVKLIMLVVTPEGFETEHLEVMKTLVQMISDDRIRTRLIAAIDANDAWEVIESEETPNYNYYLDDAANETDEGRGEAYSSAG